MEELFYYVLALLPAVVLLAFILWRDRLRPEPAKELILACVMGLLTVPFAMCLTRLFENMGVTFDPYGTTSDCLKTAFVGAAIPEELGKLLILWLFFRWRRHQDEVMDGIVYAVCIGLVFAAYENVTYMSTALGWQSFNGYASAPMVTGVLRALTAVPAHFCFAVAMGFFFSLYLFGKKNRWLFLLLSYLVPVLFHGLYDFLAFLENISPMWFSVISFLFFFVFFAMNNLCIKLIRTAIQVDDRAYELAAKKNAADREGESGL
ncbi:MAG: PrsW family intramembrane metalloprotease [Bacteroidales bacterium]|nr:PrsW family intramembrane metalloprotease [Bacteroidales bacterium]